MKTNFFLIGLFIFNGTIASAQYIELIEFNAAQVKDSVVLHWVTASEKQSKEFAIERSLDTVNFTELGRIPAAGNSDMLINYYFTDHGPFNDTCYYYRLKSVTITDSSYTVNRTVCYSSAVPVNEIGNYGNWKIYPNPFSDFTVVSFGDQSADGYSFKIYNTYGQILEEKNNLTGGQLMIEKGNLQGGIYFLQVRNSKQEIIISTRLIAE